MTSRESSTQALDRLGRIFAAEAFTLIQAESHGFNHQQIQRLARPGLVRRLKRGTYVCEAQDPDAALAGLQARLFHECGIPAVISGTASARLWGMKLPFEAAGAPTILLVPHQTKTRRGRRHGLVVRSCDVDADDFVEWGDGLQVTSPIRTSLDIACYRQPRWSALWVLIVGMRRQIEFQITNSVHMRCSDHHIARHLQSELVRAEISGQLAGALDRKRGWGDRGIRSLIPHADVRLESPLEARSWWEWSLANLPMPEPQAWVQGVSGRWYRADFRWDRVLGEADGAMKYATLEDLYAEKRRQEDLERAGFLIVRWSWAEMVDDPASVVTRIRDAVARVCARSIA